MAIVSASDVSISTVIDVEIDALLQMAVSNEKAASGFSNVRHVILVLSGKGGVGKSTVAVQLSAALRQAGNNVGLLDIDLCGPSIPRMLKLEGHSVHQCPEGWVPVYADESQTLSVMSIGFLVEKNDQAIIWRGPKKNAMIRQFLTDVCWSDIDYLVIDTPPGTSDEHMAVVDVLKRHRTDGAILVTTPQAVAVGDVRREVTFCKKTGIPILGIVENMSGFACPTCQECTNIFSKGGGEALANYCAVPFLGTIPLDPQLAECAESGSNYLNQFPSSPVATVFQDIVEKLSSGNKTSDMDES